MSRSPPRDWVSGGHDLACNLRPGGFGEQPLLSLLHLSRDKARLPVGGEESFREGTLGRRGRLLWP